MTEARHQRYLYWRFNVLGVATLVVWNIFIVSSDFFRYEFRNTPFRDNFESVFSILSNSVNLVALCYALYTQPKADHDRRIKNGLLATASVLGTIFLLSVCGGEGWAALAISLLALCVAAVAAAYIQCSIFGIAALLPPCCAEGYMSGQAIAGTLASGSQLVAVLLDKSASSSGLDIARDGSMLTPSMGDYWRLRLRTAAYFLVAALFLVMSVAVWTQLNTQLALLASGGGTRDLGGYVRLDTDIAGDLDAPSQPNADGVLVTTMREDSPRLARANQASFPDAEVRMPAQYQLSRTELRALASEVTAASAGHVDTAPDWLVSLGLSNAQQLYKTFAEISPYVYICAIVMGQTLAVFPPLTEAIVSSPHSLPRIDNLTAWHFFLFNAGDYLGRLTTQWLNSSSSRVLHGANGVRMLLIPAFLLFPTLATSPHAAWVIHSDVLFLSLVLVLGWSNGWVATAALIAGPLKATNKELAGSLLGFALCVGLVIGAAASYPLLLLAGIS
ncbi:hypothetical protein IWW39_000351 [Coemansia spiralis]|uniref:Uncharacterized protein n=1 Tax=Coemansia spiralis TaxID=417178 RepID=A0A9W8GNU0_9FUNG|nr:hypothetical protein IWW39_000351 [Coemansia spiralis]